LTPADHIIELEMKISHQEVAIEELKQTVFEQHLALEKLEKELKRLNDRIEGIDGGPTIGPGNDKPPHY
jgi:SlyX protein